MTGGVTGKKLLLVEDEKELRNIVMDLLELDGATVFPAEDGIRAFELLKSRSVDLILSDLDIPGEGADGLTLLKKVRNLYDTASLPFIFITGSQDFTQEFVQSKGANALVRKPFSIEGLEFLIEKTIKFSESERAGRR
jgi:CheY-like chemotaxis protein